MFVTLDVAAFATTSIFVVNSIHFDFHELRVCLTIAMVIAVSDNKKVSVTEHLGMARSEKFTERGKN